MFGVTGVTHAADSGAVGFISGAEVHPTLGANQLSTLGLIFDYPELDMRIGLPTAQFGNTTYGYWVFRHGNFDYDAPWKCRVWNPATGELFAIDTWWPY